MDDTAWCKRCERMLPRDDFGTYHRRDDDREYRATYCRECERARSKQKRRMSGRVSRADFLAKSSPRNRGVAYVPLTTAMPPERLAAALKLVSDEPRPLTIRERLEAARQQVMRRSDA